jgi:serine/threonine-protein kinase
VNGDTAGTTPLNGHAFEAGTAQLLVQKDGYAAWDTTLTAVEAGGRVALQNVSLTRAGTEGAVADDSNEQPAEESTTSASDSRVAGTTEPDPSAEASNDPQPATAEGSDEDPAASNTERSDTDAATGILDVTPEPSGTVVVDGQQQSGGTIPLQVGRHTVTCRHPDYGTVDTTLTVSEGQTQTLSCYFTQSVTVNTTGAWGRIWLNGSNTGKNTNATLSLPPGTHRIEVRRESLSDFRANGGKVKVERGTDSQINSFTGTSYQFEVEPGFTKIERAVLFTVGGQ